MKKIGLLSAFIYVVITSCTELKEKADGWVTESPYELVNPFIGTGGHGHTYPGATLPFGMVQLSPDTRLEGWDGCSAYHFTDSIIYGFSHTHLSGTGVSDYGDILLTPYSLDEDISAEDALNYSKTISSFDKDSEKVKPGYYEVFLKDHQVAVKLTATERIGVHHYSFEKESAKVLINLNHRDPLLKSRITIENNKSIVGARHSKAWAENQQLYFAMEFSEPFESHFLDEGDSLFVELDFGSAKEIMVKVALSSTGTEGAKGNLAQEGTSWNFTDYQQNAQDKWSKALNKIQVKGKDYDKQVIFYSALYHTMIAPNLISDVNGAYRGMDGLVHENPKDATYTIFSLWDTFRAAHPLYTLIEREKTASFIQTFLHHYQQGGKLPVWELAANETNCMIGYHSVSVIADAYTKGITDFDTKLALEAMVSSAERNEFGLKYYRNRGYISAGDEAESVSKTLEYAYDDWCIAQFAGMLNESDVEEEFSNRALNYRNLFDPETKFLRARMNGDWFKPFDPFEVNFNYTEANAWQYSLFAPHDVSGLIELHGGASSFEEHLDKLFSTSSKTTGRDQADITGLIGQYAHGNEPSHHMAYLYSYIQKPWKTQQQVHQILNEQYRNAADGLSGNEDCGQMSAWYVLSAMGMYSVTPGLDYYVMGTPMFDTVHIHLENGKRFSIVANNLSDENFFIQSSNLNEESSSASFIKQETLLKGGQLTFEMAAVPNKEWGVGDAQYPRAKAKNASFIPAPFVHTDGMTFTDSLKIEIGSIAKSKIWFQLNGEVFKPYKNPFYIDQSSELVVYAGDSESKRRSDTLQLTYKKIKKGRSVELRSEYANQYAAAGQNTMIDQLRGNANYKTGFWQGYQGQDVEAIVNLGKPSTFNSVSAGFLQDIRSWIWYPKQVEFYASKDGKEFELLGTVENSFPSDKEGAFIQDLSLKGNHEAQYIKAIARYAGDCPEWHLGAGGKSWIFIDEISVD